MLDVPNPAFEGPDEGALVSALDSAAQEPELDSLPATSAAARAGDVMRNPRTTAVAFCATRNVPVNVGLPTPCTITSSPSATMASAVTLK